MKWDQYDSSRIIKLLNINSSHTPPSQPDVTDTLSSILT